MWDCDTLALREKFAPSRKEVGKSAVVLACSSSGGLPVAFVGRGGSAVLLNLSLALSLAHLLSHAHPRSLVRFRRCELRHFMRPIAFRCPIQWANYSDFEQVADECIYRGTSLI